MAELSGKKIVIVVDDGLATGSSMQAAVLALRRLRSARILVAGPAALTETSDGAGSGAGALPTSSLPSMSCWRSPRGWTQVISPGPASGG